jgi:hypothetical protein
MPNCSPFSVRRFSRIGKDRRTCLRCVLAAFTAYTTRPYIKMRQYAGLRNDLVDRRPPSCQHRLIKPSKAGAA